MSTTDKAMVHAGAIEGCPKATAKCCKQINAMIPIAPAWIAVALQKTKRNAGNGPYASRKISYWAPLA